MIKVGEQGIYLSDSAAKKLSPYILSQFKKTLILDLNALQSISESDPVFSAWLATSPNISIFTNDAGYLTSFSETDPIYTASSWYTTTNNSSNWDTAFSWGNHASAGYLTSITSLQVTTALGYTPYNSTNPNGYITSSSLSSYLPITGATYTNTTGNGLAITSSALTTGNLVSITSTGTAAASNTNTALYIGQTGTSATATQTTYGLYVSNTKGGSGNFINIGGYFTASGGTTNYTISSYSATGWANFNNNNAANYPTAIFQGSNTQNLRIASNTSSTINYYNISRNDSDGLLYVRGTQSGYTGYWFQNSDNTKYFTFSTSGRFGINVSAPSANLHLPAGTATASTAPLKLTAGTNLTTPENGAFEFDGTSLYFTVGGIRKTVNLI